jgi:mRNA-degrading endonuclease toxin of MazEF toxin-antitoxin module
MNRVQVLPLTSVTRRVYASEALVQLNSIPHKAVADQIRTVAKERILGYVGMLGPDDMLAVEAAIRVQLELR